MNELVRHRFKIYLCLKKIISSVVILLGNYEKSINNSIIYGNKIVSSIKDLLKISQLTKEYNSAMSTFLLTDLDYKYIKEMMLKFNLLDDELSELESTVKEIMLDAE
ncbi:hypothetical protein [Clostridioides difficile]|uniref:hypothetical protein n=1 Tax=Clostridioides difficile TaxID=1496 RepID=UPI0029C25CE3|nr:hypothetical protein [Clostridioides difficile]MDX5610263.1 hypothetical protein [Clostridioides difficile]